MAPGIGSECGGNRIAAGVLSGLPGGSDYNGLVGGFAAGDRGVREMRIKVNLFLQLLGNGLVQGAGAMLCAT